LHCRELVGVLCRDCTTNHTMLDDIVSELWRKENVTSGYCPRYRYTLIATLTLANFYYICVDFLPTGGARGMKMTDHYHLNRQLTQLVGNESTVTNQSMR
jgi:hypothetical protein